MKHTIDRTDNEPRPKLEHSPQPSESQPIVELHPVIEREVCHDEYDQYLIGVWENEGGALIP